MQEKKVIKNSRLQFIQGSMIVVSLLSVVFVSVFIFLTTERIRSSYDARNFLDGVDAIPVNPLMNLIAVSVLFAVLLAAFLLRESGVLKSGRLIYGSLGLEFAASLMIVVILNFNYNGIFFIFFADMISYVKGSRGRYFLIIGAIVCFMLTGFELVSISYRLYSIRSYIAYYNAAQQTYLLGVYNIMGSAAVALFIVYCIFIIQEQRGTIDEVSTLNEELSRANADLKNAKEQLEDYAKVTEHLGETRERNRLAREIHDTLGHTLTGLSAGLDACLVTVRDSPAATEQQLEMLSKVAKQGIQEIRYSVSSLKPDALERLSLENAITAMITEMKSVSGTEIYFKNLVGVLRFDEDEEMAIYRVIQESLTNSVRHGRATKIWITMEKKDDDVLLTIRDNGLGCTDLKKGFGTRHIIERIEMLNGTVKFDGSNGFTVVATIPIRWGEEYD